MRVGTITMCAQEEFLKMELPLQPQEQKLLSMQAKQLSIEVVKSPFLLLFWVVPI